MSDTPPNAKQQWRARPWFWVALLFSLALTISFYRPRVADGSLQAQWHLRDWRFGPYENRQPITFSPVDGYVRPAQTIILVTKGYHFGPLHVFSSRSEPEPQPLGTNIVHVGDRLYDPATRRELWRVLAVESRHEFDDGTDRDGVLVTSSVTGGLRGCRRRKWGRCWWGGGRCGGRG